MPFTDSTTYERLWRYVTEFAASDPINRASLDAEMDDLAAALSALGARAADVEADLVLPDANLIINPNFLINERAYNATPLPLLTYGHNRWRSGAEGTTYNVSGGVATITAGIIEQVLDGLSITGGTYCVTWTGTATCTVDGVPVLSGGTFALVAGVNSTLSFAGGTVQNPQIVQGAAAQPYRRRPYAHELLLARRMETVPADTAIARMRPHDSIEIIVSYGATDGTPEPPRIFSRSPVDPGTGTRVQSLDGAWWVMHEGDDFAGGIAALGASITAVAATADDAAVGVAALEASQAEQDDEIALAARPSFPDKAAASTGAIEVTDEIVFVGGEVYAKVDTVQTHSLAFTHAGTGTAWVRRGFAEKNDRLPIVVGVSGQSNSLWVSGAGGQRQGVLTAREGVWSFERHPVPPQTVGWKIGFKDSPDYVAGQGGNHPSYHFCARLARETGRPVVQIPYSIGGMPIHQWLPNGRSAVAGSNGTMWTNLLSAWGLAVTTPLPFRTDGLTLTDLERTTCDYFLWHQGEANSDAAAIYGAAEGPNFKRDLVRVFRSFVDPSLETSPANPIIRADTRIIMGDMLYPDTGNSVRNVELRQVANEITGVYLAEIGWMPDSDGVHYKFEWAEVCADAYRDAMGRERLEGDLYTVAEDGLVQLRPSCNSGAYQVSDESEGSRVHFAFGYRTTDPTIAAPQVSPWNGADPLYAIQYFDNTDLGASLATVTAGAVGVSAIKNRIQLRWRRPGPAKLRIRCLTPSPLSSADTVAD